MSFEDFFERAVKKVVEKSMRTTKRLMMVIAIIVSNFQGSYLCGGFLYVE